MALSGVTPKEKDIKIGNILTRGQPTKLDFQPFQEDTDGRQPLSDKAVIEQLLGAPVHHDCWRTALNEAAPQWPFF
jgi:hypothetical protein